MPMGLFIRPCKKLEQQIAQYCVGRIPLFQASLTKYIRDYVSRLRKILDNLSSKDGFSATWFTRYPQKLGL